MWVCIRRSYFKEIILDLKTTTTTTTKNNECEYFLSKSSFCTWTQKKQCKEHFWLCYTYSCPSEKKNLCVHRFLKIQQKSIFKTTTERKRFNPLTPKIWLLILPSSCYTFPNKLVMIIWCKIKMTTSTWYVCVFSLPFCWIMYGCYGEKLHVNHFWELKG